MLVFATAIKGHTAFPEFSALLVLDDIQLGYCDSVNETYLRRGPNITDPVDNEDQKDFTMACGAISHGMGKRIKFLKDHFNKTDGKNTSQCNNINLIHYQID